MPQSAGIALPAQAVEQAQYSVQAGADALDRLISRTPLSAVVCGNDVLAIGAIQRARERGIHIPNDLSITGYDDMELARVITPPLTTVHFPIAQVGEQTAQPQPHAAVLRKPHRAGDQGRHRHSCGGLPQGVRRSGTECQRRGALVVVDGVVDGDSAAPPVAGAAHVALVGAEVGKQLCPQRLCHERLAGDPGVVVALRQRCGLQRF